jgi:hypothetical protein
MILDFLNCHNSLPIPIINASNPAIVKYLAKSYSIKYFTTKISPKISTKTTKFAEVEKSPIIVIGGTTILDFIHFIVRAISTSGAKTNKMVRRTRKPAITVA